MTRAARLVPRLEPLRPCAAVAEGAAARRLARRLLALDDAALARLSGVAGTGLVAVIGEEADLPWIDGIVYLGRDPDAPSLLFPTALVPAISAALWERAILAAAPGAAVPLAVVDGPLRVVPLGEARPVERGSLTTWLAEPLA